MLRAISIAMVIFVFSLAANPPPAMAAFISSAFNPPPVVEEKLFDLSDEEAPVVRADELDALARVMFCEARGEGRIGMRAVAHVAINRVEDGRWRNTLIGVLSQRAQFTCWTMLGDLHYSGEAWDIAKDEAFLALIDATTDPTVGATHYHADYVSPRWARSYARSATIGRHIFYT